MLLNSQQLRLQSAYQDAYVQTVQRLRIGRRQLAEVQFPAICTCLEVLKLQALAADCKMYTGLASGHASSEKRVRCTPKEAAGTKRKQMCRVGSCQAQVSMISFAFVPMCSCQ